MITKDKPARKDRVQSLEKGLQILLLLSRAQADLTLEELTRRSGYTKTTCFRLLKTMQDLNFVEQDPQSSAYRLGARNISVGAAALNKLSLRDTALPHMHRLRELTDETINLTILDQTDVVFVERLEAVHIISTHHHIGDRLPVHCTSMGKAILAFLPPARLEPLLEQIPLEAKTDKTITSLERFRSELARIRETGLAISDEELEKGLCAVSAPIMDYQGYAVAAINIAFPLVRHDLSEAVTRFSPQVKTAAGQISRQLGYTESSD